MLTAFDHVNIRTANLDAMIAFYGDVLDLHPGKRPDFGFRGAWLYLGGQAYVHLVETPGQTRARTDAALEHFAFRATDMEGFLARLDANGVTYRTAMVPSMPLTQINFFDPDGNHIHVDFDTSARHP